MLETLKEAKASKEARSRNKIVTVGHIETAIAWAKDEITLAQATDLLGISTPGGTLNRMASILREAVRRGTIKIPDDAY